MYARLTPKYPQIARIAHVQGEVVLQCMIDEEGNVGELQVDSGHPILAQSALEAVKQWKYRPFHINEKAVAVETTITVTFHL